MKLLPCLSVGPLLFLSPPQDVEQQSLNASVRSEHKTEPICQMCLCLLYDYVIVKLYEDIYLSRLEVNIFRWLGKDTALNCAGE